MTFQDMVKKGETCIKEENVENISQIKKNNNKIDKENRVPSQIPKLNCNVGGSNSLN